MSIKGIELMEKYKLQLKNTNHSIENIDAEELAINFKK